MSPFSLLVEAGNPIGCPAGLWKRRHFAFDRPVLAWDNFVSRQIMNLLKTNAFLIAATFRRRATFAQSSPPQQDASSEKSGFAAQDAPVPKDTRADAYFNYAMATSRKSSTRDQPQRVRDASDRVLQKRMHWIQVSGDRRTLGGNVLEAQRVTKRN